MMEIGSNDNYTLMVKFLQLSETEGTYFCLYKSRRVMTKIGSNDNYTLMPDEFPATFREGTSFFSFSNLYDENWFN